MRKVLIGVAAVLVLLVAVIVAIPFFVPVDAIRDRVVAEVKSATGRDLTVEGPVGLSIFPSVAVELSDVSLSNAPGAAREDMVTLGQLDVEVALFPLLSGEIAVKRLILREPVIALEVDESGQPNWVFERADAAADMAKAPEGETDPRSQGGIGLSDLRLDEVGIIDGMVVYADRRTGRSFEATRVAVDIELESLDSPLALTGGMEFQGRSVRFELNADRPRGLVAGDGSSLSAKLTANAVDLFFDGQVATTEAPELRGRLSLSIPSIADLADWLSITLSEGGLPVDTVALESTLSASPTTVALETATLKIDDIEASGDIAVSLDGRRPALFGRLAVDQLDLDPLLPPAPEDTTGGSGGAAPPPGAAASDWSDDPIDFSPLLLADADLVVASEGMSLRGIEAGPTVLTTMLKDGVLDFDLSRTSLLGGTVALQLGANGAAPVPSIRFRLQIDDVQAEPVLAAFADFERLTGAASAEMALTASGRSERALVKALNGTGTVVFRNGTIKGINLAAMVRNVASAFTDPASGETRETDFAELGASFQIVDGVARSDDIRLLAPLLRIEGRGRANLPPRTLSVRLEPKLVATTEGQGGALQQTGVGVPVIIEGTFDNPTFRPDLEGLVTQTLQDPSAVREQVEGVVDQLREGVTEGAVQDLLEGLTGGTRQSESSGESSGEPSGEPAPPNPADAIRSLLGR